MSERTKKRNPLIFVFAGFFFITIIVSFFIEKYGHQDSVPRTFSPDEQTAKEFMDRLPGSCNDSRMVTKPEGVVITVKCEGVAKSNNGKITITDGVITSVINASQ